jgi:AraC-like DNA-binding protein
VPSSSAYSASGAIGGPSNSTTSGRDALLIRTLEEHASNLVRRIPSNMGIGARAAREIATRLREGDVSLAAIARSLAMSERTLQRHLSLEGYTFEGLVDDVRREAAEELLKDSGLSVTEIGYLLGYSGPAAFHRAYKRWTGAAPRSGARKASS